MRIVTVLLLGTADVPNVAEARLTVGRFTSWNTDARMWFDAQLAGAVIGWRCILVGPHAELAAAAECARQAGAVDEEITTVVTGRAVRRVYCAGCAAVTTSLTPTVGCTGCGLTLSVGEHFSPRLSAYLGSP